MYRWQNPPILPIAYASAHRSSNRRCRSIERSSSRFTPASPPSTAPPASAGASATAVPPFAFFFAMCVVSVLGGGGLGGLHLLPRVVARAHQRRALDVLEAEREADLAEPAEVLRRHVPVERDVRVRRPE